jgi:two-component system, OmpR family, sensor histidine kinase BaeS
VRKTSLGLQVFAAIVLVALGAVLAVGVIARSALATAFDAYLAQLPTPEGGMHMGRGRQLLGAAEQTFVASVDRSVYIGAFVAIVIAAVVALLLARYLSRPLRRLEAGAEDLAAGNLSPRVDVAGPAEVAALGDAFNSLADSLEEAEALRRRLVADVAHELRNPIAAARAQAEGMAEGVLAAEPARLDSLVDDLKHLSALVDDLQELAVAEAGRMHYEMVQLDLAELARREIERVRPSLADGVEIVDMIPVETAFEVEGDARRLSQVLRNLLSNAARHTRTGTIGVSLARVGDQVEARVADTGDGIPEHDLPHIFERFYRADSARAAATGGAGLGLAISRTIVEDHGGSVFAESTPGEGTTVGFRLPAGD